jgi:hypothetical protein
MTESPVTLVNRRPDPVVHQLFEVVATAAKDHGARNGWPPQLFSFMDAFGVHGDPWPPHELRGLLTHQLQNKLIGARQLRCRSQDARGVLPGAVSRSSGLTKLLLACRCLSLTCFRVMSRSAGSPTSPSHNTRLLAWFNEHKLFCLGEPGAVPIFTLDGEFVCAIGAAGGEVGQDEAVVEAGLSQAGLEKRGKGWVLRGEHDRTPAARLAAGSPAPGGASLADSLDEMSSAIQALEAAISGMDPGCAAMRMQARFCCSLSLTQF